ncbi:hypothetical protein [Pediococcus parvulus]|uniref:Rgg family transcriptional regulator n=1 Tax=Pediococcus parvulus TaxID=54062 RepID=UPI000A0375EA
MSYSHLLKLLERIKVKPSEFDYLYYQRNKKSDNFVVNLQEAYQSGNITVLRQYLNLWHKGNNRYSKLQVIQLKMMLITLGEGQISKKEITYLQEYFAKIENWSFYELYLFGHAMPFMDVNSAASLIRVLAKKINLYGNFRQDSFSIVFYLYNNLILNLVAIGDFEQAMEFVNLLKNNSFSERDYYHKTRYFSLEGLVKYMQNEKEEGVALLKRSIDITVLVMHDDHFITNEFNFLKQYITDADLKRVFINWNNFK